MNDAKLRLRPTEPCPLEPLGAELARLLNRAGEPEVTVETDRDELAFACPTWSPILEARVDEAMDELLGTTWRVGFAPSHGRGCP